MAPTKHARVTAWSTLGGPGAPRQTDLLRRVWATCGNRRSACRRPVENHVDEAPIWAQGPGMQGVQDAQPVDERNFSGDAAANEPPGRKRKYPLPPAATGDRGYSTRSGRVAKAQTASTDTGMTATTSGCRSTVTACWPTDLMCPSIWIRLRSSAGPPASLTAAAMSLVVIEPNSRPSLPARALSLTVSFSRSALISRA